MRNLLNILVFAAFLVSPMGILLGRAESPSGTIDGVWKGRLAIAQTSNAEASREFEELPLQLTIQADKADVVFRDKSVKAGKFKVVTVGASAVVFAIDSGTDEDGTWIESWVFSTTQKDAGTLIVNLSWMVNNTNLAPDNKIGRLHAIAVGEFRRMP